MAVEDSNTKKCSKCGETKSVKDFPKHANHRDGIGSQCKSCKNIAAANRYALNIDKAREDRAKYYAANKLRINARNNKYRNDNKDKVKVYMSKWYAENADKVKAASLKWGASNPEKLRSFRAKWKTDNPQALRIYDQNRRARKRESGGKLSHGLSERLFKLQRGKCACGCKQPLGDDYHLDHIMPLALGGSNTDDNIQLLRSECNLKKNAKHPVDFMRQRGFLL